MKPASEIALIQFYLSSKGWSRISQNQMYFGSGHGSCEMWLKAGETLLVTERCGNNGGPEVEVYSPFGFTTDFLRAIS